MNPRIRELAEQAGINIDSFQFSGTPIKHIVGESSLENFAELIVRECCEVLEQTEDALDRQKWPTPRGCVEYIKDHFEVEQ